MLNWWLILLIILVPLICIGLTVYVIVYFQSEEDSGWDYAPKSVAGLGFLVALGAILLVPYDVANSPDPTVEHKFSQTINAVLMWKIVLWTMAALAVVVCPLFLFFYEAFDPDKPSVSKQAVQGVISTLVIVVLFAVIVGPCYYYAGFADIELISYEGTPQKALPESPNFFYTENGSRTKMAIPVSFYTYCMGMLCFFGWVLFFFYGGIGVAAYPIGLIKGFQSHTRSISASRFAEEMAIILAKADAILGLCAALQKESRGRISRSTKNKINIVRNEVYFLEAQQSKLIWAYKTAGGSPFIVYGKLLLGIVCVIIMIMWTLQIFVYNTFDADPFLNTLLLRLTDAFGLLGVCAYSILAFYLMWSTFQGQIALGLRFFFFQIHPMKRRDTLVNAFLFNASLLLITSFAVLFFVVRSFRDYVALTAINGLMNVFVAHLRGIGVLLKWVQFFFLGMSILALILALVWPRKKRGDPAKLNLDDLK